MADKSRDTAQPRGPGAPIPRMWKAPEPTEDPPPPPVTSKAKAKAKKSKSAIDDWNGERNPADIEATPDLDTVESRQKIRLIAGAVIVAVLALIIIIIVSVSKGKPESKPIDDVTTETESNVKDTIATSKQREGEAKYALDQVKLIAVKGQTDEAVRRLERLLADYEQTQAGAEAKIALDRHKNKQTLFATPEEIAAKAVLDKKAADEAARIRAEKKKLESEGTGSEFSPTTKVATNTDPNSTQPMNGTNSKSPMPNGANSSARVLPAGFRPVPNTKMDMSGWPMQIICERDDMMMVLVPGGRFNMGNEGGADDEKPVHPVVVSPYYMDRHEVTVSQFDRFRQDSAGRGGKPINWTGETARKNSVGNNPVVMVQQIEATAYATWAGKALPTEAQWEFAVRGPDNRLYPKGIEPPKWDRKPKQIDTVMSYDEDMSIFGVYDLAGNAWEWTREWYDPKRHQKFVGNANQPAQDPLFNSSTPTNNTKISIKGGDDRWRGAWRDGQASNKRADYLGFRCVLDLTTLTDLGGSGANSKQAPGDSKKSGIVSF